LETDRPLETGARLVMEMRCGALAFRLIAEVRSVKADPRNFAGLGFVGISAEGLKNLKSLIKINAQQSPPPESTNEG